MRRPQNLKSVEHGYTIRIYAVILDLTHIYVLQCSALYGVDHNDFKACIREELEQDEMVMRRRFHDNYWPCSAFQLDLMQLFLCKLHADHVMVDFLPEQHIVVRTEDAQVAETLADVNTCYWNEDFHETTSYAGQHPDAGIDMRVKYAGKRQGRTHPA